MSYNFWFSIISLGLGFGLNFGGSKLPDALPLPHKDLHYHIMTFYQETFPATSLLLILGHILSIFWFE
jgi:hypothetical protein